MVAKVELRETVNKDAVILDADGRGNPMAADRLQQQINSRPGAENFPIPGQVTRKPDGTIKHTPLRAPGFPEQNQPIQYPNNYPQMQDGKQFVGQPQQTPVFVNQGSGLENLSDNKPIFNLFKAEDAFYFFLELPGLIKDTLKINIVGDRKLNIECEFQDISELVTNLEMEKKNLQKKRKGLIVNHKSNDNRSKKFKHSYELSSSIDKSNYTAKLENGVLHMYLPFKESEETTVNVTVL